MTAESVTLPVSVLASSVLVLSVTTPGSGSVGILMGASIRKK